MAVARIRVRLKPTVLDAQGAQVRQALHSLGFEQVQEVRMGRYIEVELADAANAEPSVRAMCDQLLANPVIETYDFEIGAADPRTAVRGHG
jgi:phosphoribosylformylglycinamidine synthase PurS subunit